jgi:hypothetical protein
MTKNTASGVIKIVRYKFRGNFFSLIFGENIQNVTTFWTEKKN